jgi:hypothetical protein
MVIVNDRLLRFLTFFLGGKELPAGMAFFPFVIINSQVEPTPELINHERIHLRQQIELLVIPFYIWYLIAYYRKGYMQVSFEKEAYDNDHDLTYINKRSIFAFCKYFN